MHEKPRGQILDAAGEVAREHRADTLATDQGRARQAVVADRVAPDPLLIAAGVDLLRRCATRRQCADERAHARAGDAVDPDAELLQCLDGADVAEPARTAARQNEPDGASREAPRDRGDVLATALARADAVGRARLERVEQPVRRRVARPAEQDHVGGGRQRLMEACRRPGGRVVGDDEQHPIGLSHARLAPLVFESQQAGRHDDVLVVSLELIHDLRQRGPGRRSARKTGRRQVPHARQLSQPLCEGQVQARRRSLLVGGEHSDHRGSRALPARRRRCPCSATRRPFAGAGARRPATRRRAARSPPRRSATATHPVAPAPSWCAATRRRERARPAPLRRAARERQPVAAPASRRRPPGVRCARRRARRRRRPGERASFPRSP